MFSQGLKRKLILWLLTLIMYSFHLPSLRVQLATGEEHQNGSQEDQWARFKMCRMSTHASMNDITGKTCHAWHRLGMLLPIILKQMGKKQTLQEVLEKCWVGKIKSFIKVKLYALEAKTWPYRPKIIGIVLNWIGLPTNYN